jgi:hypothetical protein
MTIDDPGWGGFIGDEPGEPLPATGPDTTAGAEAEMPPDMGPDISPPEPAAPVADTGSRPPRPPASPPKKGIPRAALIAVAAVVVVGGGVGIALALSGKKTPTPTTTSTTTTSSNTSSTGPTGNTGNGNSSEPSLISVVPTALSGRCEQVPTADFISTASTDEISCDAAEVSGSEADLIGYARFASSTKVGDYFSGLLKLNSLSANTGNCSSLTLSGSTSGGDYCASSYTDSDGNSGSELAFVGSSFQVGGADGSSTTFCEGEFPGSTGVSVVAWTSPSDDSFGFALDCTDSSTTFVDGMESDLVHADYVLGD